MPESFHEIKLDTFEENVFKLIGKDCFLLTAGTRQHYNTMTGGWGGFGVLWGKKIALCVVRPHRYTYEFMEKADVFSLSFLDETNYSILEYCGSHTGREVDKAAACGLTPIETSDGIISFTQARLVIECKKIYYQDINPEHFLDAAIEKCYPKKDYHRMYIGEVLRILVRDQQE